MHGVWVNVCFTGQLLDNVTRIAAMKVVLLALPFFQLNVMRLDIGIACLADLHLRVQFSSV